MKVDYILHREMEKVLDLLTPGNRLVMEVAMHTGLRVSDVLALKKCQIRQQFTIREQKTGKKRRVNLTQDLVENIMREAGGGEWAFPGKKPGRPRTRQAVWADVKRAQRAFRLTVNLGTHTARKIYAVDLYYRYGDVERVRRALNHNGIEVTMLYAMADVLTQRRLERKMRRRHRSGVDN